MGRDTPTPSAPPIRTTTASGRWKLFVEKTITGQRVRSWGTRLGRYRTPFGIYNRSDHAYTGFLRAPLIRYGGYWALSNNFLETGASVVAGTLARFGEVSLGIPQDEDDLHRAPRLRPRGAACRPRSAP